MFQRSSALPGKTDVVVVGNGPTGLVTALALAQQDVDFIVVDARTERSRLPRSRWLDATSVEVLRRLGVADEVAEAAIGISSPCDPFGFGRTLAEVVADGVVVKARFGRSRSPASAMLCPQNVLEPILCGYVPRGRSFWAHRAVDIRQTDDDVEVAVEHDGRTQLVRTRYVVGADGADSTVRDLLGIPLDQHQTVATVVSVLFSADLEDLVAKRRSKVYFLEPPEGPRAILYPTKDQGIWSADLIFQYGADESVMTSKSVVQRMVRRLVGTDTRAIDVLEWQVNDARSGIANRFVSGRVLLAGDAAHQVSPVGGSAVDLGVRDANNLAWKVAAVVKGYGGRALIESYDVERRPAVERHVRAYQDILATIFATGQTWQPWRDLLSSGLDLDLSVYEARYERGAFVADAAAAVDLDDADVPDAVPGSRAPSVAVPAGGGTNALLDEFGPDYLLLAVDAGWRRVASRVSERTGIPVRTRVFPHAVASSSSRHWTRAYGIKPTGAVLIRPDGYVGWRYPECAGRAVGGERDAAALVAALTRLVS